MREARSEAEASVLLTVPELSFVPVSPHLLDIVLFCFKLCSDVNAFVYFNFVMI